MADQKQPRNALGAQRNAIQAHKQRVFVAMRRHGPGRDMQARVLIDGEYYDVDARQLAKLQGGATPQDLELYPADTEPLFGPRDRV